MKYILFIGLLLLTACSSTKYDVFAQCLTEQGAVMYGTEWCSHCKAQKEMFSSSFQYIAFIDCDLSKEECLRNDVTGYPTWVIDGENYAGRQSFERLSALSGCELP